jgi:hypothetical protein
MAEVIIHGEAFGPQAPALIAAACRDAETAVAQATQDRVRFLGQSKFRYERPTYNVPGKWRSNVRMHARGSYHVVTDSGIIYGHWLEGTGSRNRTTRFKGYFMWRKALQVMNRGEALKVAVPIIARAVRAINR